MGRTKALSDDQVNYIVQQYKELADYYLPMKNGSIVAFYTHLAEKLSRVVNRPNPWGWRYAHGVLRGTIRPSTSFAKAVTILAAEVDGMPARIVRLEKVDVFAEPGTVQHGAIVMSSSRVCDAPGCNRVFVPNVPHRKRCPICRPPKK